MGFSLSDGLKTIATGGLNLVAGGLRGGSAPTGNYNQMLKKDKDNALFNFKLNNNISNPFGSQQVVSDGNGGWMTKTSYAEPIQSATTGYMNMLPGLQQRAATAMSQPSSFDPNDPNYRQKIADALLSRMDFGGDEESLRTRLANQGLTEGSEAWGREMDQFGRQKNDARMQAFLSSGDEMQNLFNLDQAARTAPLSEYATVNQAMTGGVPQFNQFQSNYQLTNPAAQRYQEQLDGYNARQARRSQVVGGLFQLGAAALGSKGGGGGNG